MGGDKNSKAGRVTKEERSMVVNYIHERNEGKCYYVNDTVINDYYNTFGFKCYVLSVAVRNLFNCN